jgi:hypothetical protein
MAGFPDLSPRARETDYNEKPFLAQELMCREADGARQSHWA